MASGAITVMPNGGPNTTQYGLLAHAGDPSLTGVLGAGNASVTFSGGTLEVSAVRPRAILAWIDGQGSATVATGANTVINVSGTQFGGLGFMSFRARPPPPNYLRTWHRKSQVLDQPMLPTFRSAFGRTIAVRTRQLL